eukprot:UN3832
MGTRHANRGTHIRTSRCPGKGSQHWQPLMSEASRWQPRITFGPKWADQGRTGGILANKVKKRRAHSPTLPTYIPK